MGIYDFRTEWTKNNNAVFSRLNVGLRLNVALKKRRVKTADFKINAGGV